MADSTTPEKEDIPKESPDLLDEAFKGISVFYFKLRAEDLKKPPSEFQKEMEKESQDAEKEDHNSDKNKEDNKSDEKSSALKTNLDFWRSECQDIIPSDVTQDHIKDFLKKERMRFHLFNHGMTETHPERLLLHFVKDPTHVITIGEINSDLAKGFTKTMSEMHAIAIDYVENCWCVAEVHGKGDGTMSSDMYNSQKCKWNNPIGIPWMFGKVKAWLEKTTRPGDKHSIFLACRFGCRDHEHITANVAPEIMSTHIYFHLDMFKAAMGVIDKNMNLEGIALRIPHFSHKEPYFSAYYQQIKELTQKADMVFYIIRPCTVFPLSEEAWLYVMKRGLCSHEHLIDPDEMLADLFKTRYEAWNRPQLA